MNDPPHERRGNWVWFALAGSACWLVVVLVHVAERFQLLPRMGWGLPNSPGHYLDLSSAIGGAALFLAASILKLRHRS